MTLNKLQQHDRPTQKKSAKSVSERKKMVHSNPFLTPHLETPKDITIKRGKATSGTQLHQHAKCHDNRLHRSRDICSRTRKQSQQTTYPTILWTTMCAGQMASRQPCYTGLEVLLKISLLAQNFDFTQIFPHVIVRQSVILGK